jgi:hypothetical protein
VFATPAQLNLAALADVFQGVCAHDNVEVEARVADYKDLYPDRAAAANTACRPLNVEFKGTPV